MGEVDLLPEGVAPPAAGDFATYGAVVGKAVAGVASANGTAEDPKACGEKVARRLFPNILSGDPGGPRRTAAAQPR